MPQVIASYCHPSQTAASAKVWNGSTLVGTSASVAATARAGLWEFTFASAIPAGWYDIEVFQATGVAVSNYPVYSDGSSAALAHNGAAVLDSATQEQLDEIQAAAEAGGGDNSEVLDAVTATNARLDNIAAKTNLINAGRLRVLSRVAGNVITAHAGDDHLILAENALTLEVDDDDASLYALLTDAANLNVKFGAGRASDTDADDISATIPASNVRHEGTQTFIDIELPSAATLGRRGEYDFDIQITNAAGYKITPQQLQGTLMIEVDRRS